MRQGQEHEKKIEGYRKVLETLMGLYKNKLLHKICRQALDGDGYSEECERCSKLLEEAREELPELDRMSEENLKEDLVAEIHFKF